jgi:hypothetical protein
MTKGFQSVNLFWWVIIPGAIIISFLLAHYHNVIPFRELGGLGVLLSSVVSNYHTLLIVGFWALVIAHGYEAVVARRICYKLKIDQQSTLLWTIQTFIIGFYPFEYISSFFFIVGFPSLKILKGYARRRE